MHSYPKSTQILEANRRFIPGGVVSVNRATNPPIVFVKGDGAYLWDADGNRYIDYHAAFAAVFLGHNDPDVSEAVAGLRGCGASLYGSGTTELEGRLAELVCTHVPAVESVSSQQWQRSYLPGAALGPRRNRSGPHHRDAGWI